MSAEEILTSEWEEFFRDFTRFHQSWIISVDVFRRAIGAHKEADERVFAGIAAQTRSDGEVYIEISSEDAHHSRLTHTIAAPLHIRYEQEGESELLQIDDAVGTTMLISCHRPTLLSFLSYGA